MPDHQVNDLQPLLGRTMAEISDTSSREQSSGRLRYVGGLHSSREVGNRALPRSELTLEESTAGGLGRHLGYLIGIRRFGRMVGSGIFAVPSSVTAAVGSTGATLMVFTLALLLSFAGMAIWLELGCMIPRSGGTKVYLEAAFPKPKLLTTALFSVQATLLCFTASGLIVFASNLLFAAGVYEASAWIERGIAVAMGLCITAIHTFFPMVGVQLMNVIGGTKIALLTFVVISGWIVLAGKVDSVPDPKASFRHAFSGSATSASVYATALFKALGAYSGWANATYVMNEVQNPVRTLKIAGPTALAICGCLYTCAIVTYFSALKPDEVAQGGVTVVAAFAKKVFGETGMRAISFFVALSALGNTMAISFAQGRLNQELAKEGLFPFSRVLASNWPVGTPMAGLILHLMPTFIILLAVPMGDIYNFIIDVEVYPDTIISFLVVTGFFYLRWALPDLERPFKAWLAVPVFFLAGQIFLIVSPWIPPPNGVGDTTLPYWLYPLVGISMLSAGLSYWVFWRVLLPFFGSYTLKAKHARLSDGTVVVEYERVRRTQDPDAGTQNSEI
ncbi:hypothetical protein KEM54_002265 [Ascosphaera aggregata]|nr:hypothetical protein KEM54_002265 [Ascosphaera aggregata]